MRTARRAALSRATTEILVLLLAGACSGPRRQQEPRQQSQPSGATRPQPAAQASASDPLTRWLVFDFTLDTIPSSDIEGLASLELAQLRGIVFGRHGRVFKDPEIQSFLGEQAWYKPDLHFDNAALNDVERHNLDLIREAETRAHPTLELGDMRFYRDRMLSARQFIGRTDAELRILAAEVEAIHGKRFDDEPWVQHYFDARYWYHPNDHYKQDDLSEVEMANVATIADVERTRRHLAVSPGDMEHFQTVSITDSMLHGLSLFELRLLRNEIYARRGRRFHTPWLARYFEQQDWYQADSTFREPTLSAVEHQNVETIVAYENRIHEQLSQQAINLDLLRGLYLEDARKLRDEIYARHGKVFANRWLQSYFASFGWYKPNSRFTEAALNEIEKQNVAAILGHEQTAQRAMDAFEG